MNTLTRIRIKLINTRLQLDTIKTEFLIFLHPYRQTTRKLLEQLEVEVCNTNARSYKRELKCDGRHNSTYTSIGRLQKKIAALEDKVRRLNVRLDDTMAYKRKTVK